MKKFKNWLGPLLFTLFPTVAVYAHNIDQLSPDRLIIPLIYSILFLGVSACVFTVLLKSVQKASILTSLWMLLFFSYGHVYLYLGSSPMAAVLPVSINKLLLSMFLALLVVVSWLLFRAKKPLQKIVSFLSLVSLTLTLLNLLTIIPFEVKRVSDYFKLKSYIKNQLATVQIAKEPVLKPDIYYFVFDRYGRQDVLQQYLDFDNQAQLDYLKNKNFLVTDHSYANYPNTFISLSSSLNMTYLDFLTDNLGKNQRDRYNVYHQLIENNLVARTLQGQGYKYVLAGSSWDPTRVTGIADENDNLFADFDEFHLFIYERTLLNTFRGFVEGEQLYTGVERLNRMALNFNYRLSKIKQLRNQPQPVFLVAHFLMPHDPTIMSADCEPLTFDEIRNQTEEEGYLKEVACVNKVMQNLVTEIQSNSDRPTVIIFQSDEGPYLPAKYFNQDGKLIPENQDSYFIHSAIFTNLYLPQKENPQQAADYAELGLDSNFSPVNIFRTVFNYYFETDLPLLENKSYIFKDEEHPYHFVDLTETLKQRSKN